MLCLLHHLADCLADSAVDYLVAADTDMGLAAFVVGVEVCKFAAAGVVVAGSFAADIAEPGAVAARFVALVEEVDNIAAEWVAASGSETEVDSEMWVATLGLLAAMVGEVLRRFGRCSRRLSLGYFGKSSGFVDLKGLHAVAAFDFGRLRVS